MRVGESGHFFVLDVSTGTSRGTLVVHRHERAEVVEPARAALRPARPAPERQAA